METKIYDDDTYTAKHLKKSYRSYQNEKKISDDYQNQEKKNINKCLKKFSNNLKNFFKHEKACNIDYCAFNDLDIFQKELEKAFNEYQQKELKLLDEYIGKHNMCFSSISNKQWNLDASKKVIKQAIKEEKRNIAKKRKLQKQELKRNSYMSNHITIRRTTDDF